MLRKKKLSAKDFASTSTILQEWRQNKDIAWNTKKYSDSHGAGRGATKRYISERRKLKLSQRVKGDYGQR